MAKIDIREIDEDEEITEIYFTDDEYLSILESNVLYVHSDGKKIPIFLESIPNMIVALEHAKAIWEEH
jgi:hypothetical protein